MLTALASIDTSHSNGLHILAVIVLIGAILASVVFLLGLVGLGSWQSGRYRSLGSAGWQGPLVVAVILWLIYFLVL